MYVIGTISIFTLQNMFLMESILEFFFSDFKAQTFSIFCSYFIGISDKTGRNLIQS